MRGSSLIIIPEGISNLSHPSPNEEGLRVRPSCILITKLNTYEHYETFANNLQAITFLFMDKKVTKKTIWPQFRITALTKLDDGIEGAEGLGLLLSKFARVQ